MTLPPTSEGKRNHRKRSPSASLSRLASLMPPGRLHPTRRPLRCPFRLSLLNTHPSPSRVFSPRLPASFSAHLPASLFSPPPLFLTLIYPCNKRVTGTLRAHTSTCPAPDQHMNARVSHTPLLNVKAHLENGPSIISQSLVQGPPASLPGHGNC